MYLYIFIFSLYISIYISSPHICRKQVVCVCVLPERWNGIVGNTCTCFPFLNLITYHFQRFRDLHTLNSPLPYVSSIKNCGQLYLLLLMPIQMVKQAIDLFVLVMSIYNFMFFNYLYFPFHELLIQSLLIFIDLLLIIYKTSCYINFLAFHTFSLYVCFI